MMKSILISLTICVLAGFLCGRYYKSTHTKGVTNKSSCDDASTQLEMNQCTAHEADNARQRLEIAYRDLGKKLGDTDQSRALVTARAKWESYRDAWCTYVASDVTGGSLYPTEFNTCISSMTYEFIQNINNTQ